MPNGTSLAVQGFSLCASMAGVPVPSLDGELRPHMPVRTVRETQKVHAKYRNLRQTKQQHLIWDRIWLYTVQPSLTHTIPIKNLFTKTGSQPVSLSGPGLTSSCCVYHLPWRLSCPALLKFGVCPAHLALGLGCEGATCPQRWHQEEAMSGRPLEFTFKDLCPLQRLCLSIQTKCITPGGLFLF